MRDIDEDQYLLDCARRNHEGEINRHQMEWILEERGYSPEEISQAAEDFHWIHVHAPNLVRNWLIPACLLCAAILLLLARFH